MKANFEEWSEYARNKELKLRPINFESIKSNSKLKIMAITGIRRCGKTSALTLLYQLLSKEKQKVAYVNLEDGRIKNEKDVLDEILKWFGDEGYLLLDEITSVNDWEGWLARNHEMTKGKLRLIVSSSRKNLAVPNKPLRGRILLYEMYPLSFKEFLEFEKVKVEKTTAGIGKIENKLEEWLIYGGFPEVALTQNKTDKIKVLNSYFKDIIGLDVAEISGEKISVVETFGKYISDSTYFSASKCLYYFKSLGYKIAKQSLLYLEKYSQESYLFFFVPVFSYSIKNRTQYPRKAYLGDTGFMYSLNGKNDFGRLFENAVFLELKRKTSSNEEINYWKNTEQKEVDFVIREGIKTKKIIQVAYEMTSEKTIQREISALIACAKELKQNSGLIITKDQEKKERIEGIAVEFIPLWKWLLEPRVWDRKELIE